MGKFEFSPDDDRIFFAKGCTGVVWDLDTSKEIFSILDFEKVSEMDDIDI